MLTLLHTEWPKLHRVLAILSECNRVKMDLHELFYDWWSFLFLFKCKEIIKECMF